MKKRLLPALLALAVVFAAVSGGLWYTRKNTLSFDVLSGYSGTFPPAQAGRTFGLLREGSYPGLSDEPVSREEAAPYYAWLRAMRSTSYLRLPLSPPPGDGGDGFSVADGCTPAYRTYWDGILMWFPSENGWYACLPMDKKALEDGLARFREIYDS